MPSRPVVIVRVAIRFECPASLKRLVVASEKRTRVPGRSPWRSGDNERWLQLTSLRGGSCPQIRGQNLFDRARCEAELGERQGSRADHIVAFHQHDLVAGDRALRQRRHHGSQKFPGSMEPASIAVCDQAAGEAVAGAPCTCRLWARPARRSGLSQPPSPALAQPPPRHRPRTQAATSQCPCRTGVRSASDARARPAD